MTIATHNRVPDGRWLAWTGGLAGAVLLHAGVMALLLWSQERGQAPPEPQGAIMVELEMAEASPSDQQGESADLTTETAAPPPSTTESEDQPTEQPVGSETAPIVEPSPQVAKAPHEPAPETPPEPPKQQPSEDAPPVAEAPLVPEPAVTLPKEVPKDEAPKTESKAEKADEVEPEKQQRGVAAPKSKSKKEQKAAASSKGKFNPNPVYQTHPAYPASARSRGLEGSVSVTYSVSASGSVTGVRVVSSSPPGVFDAAVISAISKWRFNPPGAAVSGLRKTIRFKLK